MCGGRCGTRSNSGRIPRCRVRRSTSTGRRSSSPLLPAMSAIVNRGRTRSEVSQHEGCPPLGGFARAELRVVLMPCRFRRLRRIWCRRRRTSGRRARNLSIASRSCGQSDTITRSSPRIAFSTRLPRRRPRIAHGSRRRESPHFPFGKLVDDHVEEVALPCPCSAESAAARRPRRCSRGRLSCRIVILFAISSTVCAPAAGCRRPLGLGVIARASTRRHEVDRQPASPGLRWTSSSQLVGDSTPPVHEKTASVHCRQPLRSRVTPTSRARGRA